jgi:hypothetical protein
VLEAFVDVSAEHDVRHHLEDVRRQFANSFSCYVHEFYPDAKVWAQVTVEGKDGES